MAHKQPATLALTHPIVAWIERFIRRAHHIHPNQGAQQPAYEQQLERAWVAFARQYPQWADTLFDRHFVTRQAAARLQHLLTGQAAVQPTDLARVWMAQQRWPQMPGYRALNELVLAAAALLGCVQAEAGRQGVAEVVTRPEPAASHALALFTRALAEDSQYELDWLWLATRLPDGIERRYCYERALQINPQSVAALRALGRLESATCAHVPATGAPMPLPTPHRVSSAM